MLNIESVIYKSIGRRIKSFRKETAQLTQKEFVAKLQSSYFYIDESRLSYIENGKSKKNSASFLTTSQLFNLSSLMKFDLRELILGNKLEEESLIKFVLLGIVMNGDKHYKTGEIINPIINIGESVKDKLSFLKTSLLHIENEELFNEVNAFLYKRDHLSQKTKEDLVNECIEWYRVNFGWFVDDETYLIMDDLIVHYDENLEIQSNLIINIMLGNPKFAYDFLSGVFTISKLKNGLEDNFDKLISYRGAFGGVAIDWKEIGYHDFINAFNQMWEQHKNEFINYFDTKLFNGDFEEVGLSNLSNKKLDTLIKSPNFYNLLNTLLNKSRVSPESMIGHKIVQNYLETFNIEKIGFGDGLSLSAGYNLYKYNKDIHQLTEAFIFFNDLNRNEPGELLLHINDYMKIFSLYKM